jgi:hypothetical protein
MVYLGKVSDSTLPDLSDASDETLLQMLDVERGKFTQSDSDKIKYYIDTLIERGVYPKETVEGNPNDVYAMVSGWGAYWHIWKGTLECPLCKADLRDHKMGPPGLRQIGMVDRGQDRVTHWVCPDCRFSWDRDTLTVSKGK